MASSFGNWHIWAFCCWSRTETFPFFGINNLIYSSSCPAEYLIRHYLSRALPDCPLAVLPGCACAVCPGVPSVPVKVHFYGLGLLPNAVPVWAHGLREMCDNNNQPRRCGATQMPNMQVNPSPCRTQHDQGNVHSQRMQTCAWHVHALYATNHMTLIPQHLDILYGFADR